MSSSVAIKIATITPGVGFSFQAQVLDQQIPKSFLNYEFRLKLRPFPNADRSVDATVTALDAVNGILEIRILGATSMTADMRPGEIWSGMLLSRVINTTDWLPELYVRTYVEVL